MIARVEQLIAATLRNMVGDGACIQEIALGAHADAPRQTYTVCYVDPDGKRGTLELDIAQLQRLSLEPA